MIPTNRLINEKSPYLLQHAHNPVNWYPWGEAAFNKARNEDKPIFLSIGYSACHWCHVMEKESFEDAQVAALMNDAFVSIKVDREERPDIDGVYMSVCQMLTGSGGWPLTIIMTPDKKPFFAGTYFPKNDRFGRKGLVTLIPEIQKIWVSKKNEIFQSANEITNSIKLSAQTNLGKELGEEIFHPAFNELNNHYDIQFGGFGSAPKFPSPHNLIFLLRYWKRYNNKAALEMVENTLTHMRLGGIYDHVGFGFHRYSTDREWLVPHFEKMLYDQALLAPVYLEAFQITRKELYLNTAEEILTYVMRNMTSPEGGFYSAEDADSEGVEGKFYLWNYEELTDIFEETDLFALKMFNVKPEGNWNKTNILHLEKTSEEISAELNLPGNILQEKIDTIREKLFAQREKRVHPFKDDKILTDWNGLMITAFSKAAQVTGKEIYISYAESAAEFITENLTGPMGALLHRYRDGESVIDGNIDDYAFFIQALLDLYETTFSTDYLIKAKFLLDKSLKDFWDEKSGGFFFSSVEKNELIANQKEIYDGAIPSGNSIMLLNLLRLSKMTGELLYLEKATLINRAFSAFVSKSPSAFSQTLTGIDFAAGPTYELVISSPEYDHSALLMVNSIRELYLPNKVLLLKTDSNNLHRITEFVTAQTPVEGKAALYICRNFSCDYPVTDYKKIPENLK